MKISKSQLKRLIKEEKRKLLQEMASEQLALIDYDYDSLAAIPVSWLSPDIDPPQADGFRNGDPVELISPREAEERAALVMHPGSHAVSHLEDAQMVINELHTLWELGYLNDNADWISIFR